MKKTIKIVLYFLGSVALLLVLLLIFHNAIIRFSLQKAIENRSEGKVELVLESFNLDLTDGSISIEKPVLLLKSVFMDENQNIEMNKVVFDKIEIEKLDIQDLIFRRSILANRIFIDKPGFWLAERGNNSQSNFNPDNLIKTLNQHPDMFSRLLFRIDEIEIHYGSIMLSEFASEDGDPGLVDFTILLENFDSQPEISDTVNRILFSDVFKFKLKNLHRALNSGYMLNIDSAIFNSNNRDLIIGGASLQPIENEMDQNSVGIDVARIALNEIDLEEVRGLEDLSLSSIIISDGTFINYINMKSNERQDTATVLNLDQLAQVVNDFELDSIRINNFKYLYINDYKDTVIETNEIGFMMTEVKIDSGGFYDFFDNLHYQQLVLSTGVFAIKKRIPNLTISYSGLSYSDAVGDLKLTGLQFRSDALKGALSELDINIPWFHLSGVSLPGLQKRKKQYLSVTIVNPGGDIRFTPTNSDPSGDIDKFVFPDYINFDNINIEDGNFNISKTDEFLITLTRLNVEVKGFKPPGQLTEQITYDSIRFNYEKAETYFNKASASVSSGSLSYDGSTLWIEDIDLETALPGNDGGLKIKTLSVDKFDLEYLLYKREIHFGQLMVSSPRLKGSLSFLGVNNSESRIPFRQTLVPFTIDFGTLEIKDGEWDTKIALTKENINLKTNYNLKIGPLVSMKGDTLKSLLEDLRWRLDLNNIEATVAGHRLNSKRVLLDAFQSKLTIHDLSAVSHPSLNDMPRKMEVRTLLLPLLEVNGLNYDLLINHDSITFSKILLDHANLNIRLPYKVKKTDTASERKIDLRNYLVFNYDTISANRMNLVIERPGDLSHDFIQLKNFSFNHQYAHQIDGNFINNIGFDFSEFAQFDSIKNNFLIIRDGRLGLKENHLSIKRIEGGFIPGKKKSAAVTGSSAINFKSDQIELSDIFITETLPSQLKVGKLLIGDFDLKLKQVSSAKKKTSFKINLDLLSRFSSVMTKLNIDTTVLSDIHLNYQTIEDTAIHDIDFDSVSLMVNKIDIDTAMIGQERPNLIRNLIVDLHGKTRITRDSLYEIQTGRIHYDFPNHIVTVDSFNVNPRYDEETFFKKAVYQTTRMKIFSREIKVSNINLDKLFNDNHFHLSSIDINKLDAEMYRDKRYAVKPGTFKKLPREGLMAISQKFTIDTLRVHESYLKYKQIEDKSPSPGEIFFNQINANAYNFTNVPEKGKRQYLKIEANARIMDNARMDVTTFFPLHEDSTAFWLAAKTENIDLTVLNSMTENLLGLRITRGVGSVDAQYISGNDSLARGNLIFRYKKLELKRYNRKKSQIKKKGFINFLINDLVVKSNNPKFARKPRIGQVYFVRETEKGVVAYLFRSVLTGLTSTLGFNNKEQRMERKKDRKRK